MCKGEEYDIIQYYRGGDIMNLYVYSDPSFRRTHWFSHIFCGITEAAEKRRYRLVLLTEAPRSAEDIAGSKSEAKRS